MVVVAVVEDKIGDSSNEDGRSANVDRGFWGVEPRIGEDGAPDIYFKVIKAGCPADQLTLKGDVERSVSAVLSIFSKPDETSKRDEAIGRLIKIAQLGLVSVRPATAEALESLKLFKADIVSRAMLVGLLAGLSEKVLPAAILKRAESLTSKI